MLLRYKADRRTLFFVAVYFAMFFTIWFYVPRHWLPLSIAALIFYPMNHIMGLIVHNTIHAPIFKNEMANRIFQIVLTLAFGGQVSAYVPGHNLSHHKHLQTPKDTTRTTKLRFHVNILNQLLCFFVMIPGLLKAESYFVKNLKKVRPRWAFQYNLEVIILWAWRLFWLWMDWKMFIVFSLLPNYFAIWGIFGSNFFQHDGCDENHPYNHSRNFTGKWLNYIMLNNGYHGAHHMRADMHWSLYPEFYNKEIKPYIHPALDQKYLIPYLWKSCIYPAKRVDYLGNPIQLPPDTPDADWATEAIEKGIDDKDLAGIIS
jgi:fatty acid desaturase